MAIEDEPEKNASQMVGHIVSKVDLGERGITGDPEDLWIDFEDGSRLVLNGLVTGCIEINWHSPDEVFDFERQVMEEEVADGRRRRKKSDPDPE